MGITFQQVQKYERGANRIAASRLWDLSRALTTSVSYFYEAMAKEVADASPRCLTENTQEIISRNKTVLTTRETLDLMRAYHRIYDPTVRQRVYNLTKALGGTRGAGHAWSDEREIEAHSQPEELQSAYFGDLFRAHSHSDAAISSSCRSEALPFNAIDVWMNEGGALCREKRQALAHV